jgi:hypothetical protein
LLSAEPTGDTHPFVRPWRNSEVETNVSPAPTKMQRESSRDHHNSLAAAGTGAVSAPSSSGAGTRHGQGPDLILSEDALGSISDQGTAARSLPVPPRNETVAERAPSPPPPYLRTP